MKKISMDDITNLYEKVNVPEFKNGYIVNQNISSGNLERKMNLGPKFINSKAAKSQSILTHYMR